MAISLTIQNPYAKRPLLLPAPASYSATAVTFEITQTSGSVTKSIGTLTLPANSRMAEVALTNPLTISDGDTFQLKATS
jgi:hypothetical protein